MNPKGSMNQKEDQTWQWFLKVNPYIYLVEQMEKRL